MFNEKTILELQDALDEERKADLAAIKRVLALIKRTGLSSPKKRNPQAVVGQNGTHHNNVGTLDNNEGTEESILEIIKGIDGHFTFSDLADAVKTKIGDVDRKAISAVIFRNKDKAIKVIQEGRGRRKAIYARN